jgi:hypothetical protein
MFSLHVHRNTILPYYHGDILGITQQLWKEYYGSLSRFILRPHFIGYCSIIMLSTPLACLNDKHLYTKYIEWRGDIKASQTSLLDSSCCILSCSLPEMHHVTIAIVYAGCALMHPTLWFSALPNERRLGLARVKRYDVNVNMWNIFLSLFELGRKFGGSYWRLKRYSKRACSTR